MVLNIFSDTKVDEGNQWLFTKSSDVPKNIYDLLDNNVKILFYKNTWQFDRVVIV